MSALYPVDNIAALWVRLMSHCQSCDVLRSPFRGFCSNDRTSPAHFKQREGRELEPRRPFSAP